MLSKIGVLQVYLACGNTDMRKSINGLTTLVKEQLLLDPFTQSLFVFCNRKRDKIKMLVWDHNGFWLCYRRLEKGHFKWPQSKTSTLTISQRELAWLLDGLSISQKEAHKRVTANVVI